MYCCWLDTGILKLSICTSVSILVCFWLASSLCLAEGKGKSTRSSIKVITWKVDSSWKGRYEGEIRQSTTGCELKISGKTKLLAEDECQKTLIELEDTGIFSLTSKGSPGIDGELWDICVTGQEKTNRFTFDSGQTKGISDKEKYFKILEIFGNLEKW